MMSRIRWQTRIVALTLTGVLAGTGLGSGGPVRAQETQSPEMPAAMEETGWIDVVPDEEIVEITGGTDSDTLFAGYTDRMLYGDVPTGGMAVYRAPRRNFLEGRDQYVYDRLKTMILEVASGAKENTQVVFTLQELGAKNVYTYAELGLAEGAEQSAIQKAAIKAIGEYENVINALLTDIPYEFYWFDKKSGWSRGYPGYSYTNDMVIINGNLTIGFWVTTTFSKTGERCTYEADEAKTGATISAKNKAQEIVARYAGRSDLEKLTGYRDEICNLTDYNHEAANAFPVTYGNPWQLLWVFDDDPNTKVVCEGYAKAFQYLCDLSIFSSDLTDCQTMTGMTTGNHMWNVVRMDNGFRYMADITNCDEGDWDRFFLKGDYFGSDISCTISGLDYMYDQETRSQFTAEERRLSQGASYQEDKAAGKVYRIPVESVSLNHTTISVQTGDTTQLTASILPANATNQRIIWASSDPAVATVSSDGQVLAVSSGTARIIATTQDGAKTASCTVAVLAPAVKGEWKKTGGKWWYRRADGSWPANCWEKIGGTWYHFDKNGYMQTGWLKEGGTWYYLKGSGAMATGWVKVGNTWYYMSGSGAMLTGWQKVGGTWYYLKGSGAMATGWLKDGSTWYYLKPSGAMATGWQKVGRTWYYLRPSGAMATGWLKLGSTWYYLDGSGAMLANTSRRINGKTYHFNASGACTNP